MRLAVYCFLACASVAGASAQAPTLFFSDLTSGPVGAIVTVRGANLGPAATVNGANATIVASSPTQISFVVPNTTSGSIVAGNSNPLPFTIRAGNIHYVALNGSDQNSGSLSAPWATIPYAFNTAQCGDVIYVMDGVKQTGLDAYNASLSVQRICSQAKPLALVGYPGAAVTIGDANGQEYGIRNPDLNNDGYNGMVFANLVVRGNNEALKITGNQYWRIVGSDFSCPNGGGLSACVLLSSSSIIQFLGNAIHDTGAGGTKYYHSFYATTDSNHIEVGWNHIYNNKSCRGVQFYSTGGSPQYDLIVHDNIISDQLCDGINFATVDASKGPVEAYNNLVYHVGLGGANLDNPNEACIASLGYGTPGGQGVFYGNTLADCGSAGGSTAGAMTVLSGSPMISSSSNLIVQNPGEPIYSPNTDTSLLVSSHDVFVTTGPSGVVDTNYRLVAGSPAIGAGEALAGILYDLAGTPRPQSGAVDAGAFLSSSASSGGPIAVVSVSKLSFGSVVVNSSSAQQTITLSNIGESALAIVSISITGSGASSFTETNTCGGSLATNASCGISVVFSPKSASSLSALLEISDNSAGTPQTVSLDGVGVASLADFTVSASPASLAVSRGATATYTITVGSTNGNFLNKVALSATGLPPGASATFSPAEVIPGSSPAVSTLTIQTVTTGQITGWRGFGRLWGGPVLAFLALLPYWFRRSGRRPKFPLGLALVASVGTFTALCGCSPAANMKNQTPAQTYTITVVGTSGTYVHSTQIQLTTE